MKIAYVFTGRPDAKHYAELALSAASVRRHIGSTITVVTNRASQDGVWTLRKAGLVDEVIVSETSAKDPVLASRTLKTSIGQFLDAPFLFLDTDTLARASVEPTEFDAHCIMAARNHSVNEADQQMYGGDADVMRQMGWTGLPEAHLNSGAIYFGSSEFSGAFCTLWKQLWEQSLSRTGMHFDQPSFNEAMRSFETRFRLLPDRYNAQISMAPWEERKARIIHYYGPASFREQLWTRRALGELGRCGPERAADLVAAAPPSIFEFPTADRRVLYGALSWARPRSNLLRDLVRGRRPISILRESVSFRIASVLGTVRRRQG